MIGKRMRKSNLLLCSILRNIGSRKNDSMNSSKKFQDKNDDIETNYCYRHFVGIETICFFFDNSKSVSTSSAFKLRFVWLWSKNSSYFSTKIWWNRFLYLKSFTLFPCCDATCLRRIGDNGPFLKTNGCVMSQVSPKDVRELPSLTKKKKSIDK